MSRSADTPALLPPLATGECTPSSAAGVSVDSRQAGWTARLLLPNLGVVLFAVTLLQVLLMSDGTRTLFRDSDSGWHIRTG